MFLLLISDYLLLGTGMFLPHLLILFLSLGRFLCLVDFEDAVQACVELGEGHGFLPGLREIHQLEHDIQLVRVSLLCDGLVDILDSCQLGFLFNLLDPFLLGSPGMDTQFE